MTAEMWLLVAVTGAGFVSTNVDNLLALTALTVSAGPSRVRVMSGYALSVLAVGVIALGFGAADSLAEPDLIRLLGLVPLAAGVVQLVKLVRAGSGSDVSVRSASGILPSLFVFLAMSADSVAVLGPLVADSANHLEPVVLGTWLVMGAAWVAVAGILAARPSAARLAGRAGAWVAPVLMIGVGIYILLDTPTDAFPV